MRAVAWIGLLLAGCEEGGSWDRPDPVDPVTGGCAEGLDSAVSANLVVSELIVDGVGLLAQFEPTARYEGVPSACAASGAIDLVMVFEVEGVPYGALSVAADDVGGYDVLDAGIEVSLDLFGATEPVVFTTGDWQSGTWFVAVDERGTVVELQATAVDENGRTLGLQAQLEIGP